MLDATSCNDKTIKVETAIADAVLPPDRYAHAFNATHSKLITELTTGGGGFMPAWMPLALTSPENSLLHWKATKQVAVAYTHPPARITAAPAVPKIVPKIARFARLLRPRGGEGAVVVVASVVVVGGGGVVVVGVGGGVVVGVSSNTDSSALISIASLLSAAAA